jgi:hypothetical protein
MGHLVQNFHRVDLLKINPNAFPTKSLIIQVIYSTLCIKTLFYSNLFYFNISLILLEYDAEGPITK